MLSTSELPIKIKIPDEGPYVVFDVEHRALLVP